MNAKIITVLCLVIGVAGVCYADSCCSEKDESGNSEEIQKQEDPLQSVLKQMDLATKKLVSCSAKIEYSFIQPLFETETIRKGELFYDKEKSLLRINFQTLKQDDDEERPNVEQYLFDGVWLTRIDYQLENVEYRQMVEADEPVEPFELVSRQFPIIGFTRTDQLEKDFEIKLIEPQDGVEGEAEFASLRLIVKAGSVYADEYKAMDFLVDKKNYLPAKITAISTQDEIYEIIFTGLAVNPELDADVFKVKVPAGFSSNRIVLKKQDGQNDSERN